LRYPGEIMRAIHRHYDRVREELRADADGAARAPV
jgi:hypothetical protein